MNNFTQLSTNQPSAFTVYLIVLASLLLILVIYSLPYFIKQKNTYGSPFTFASKASKALTLGATLVLFGMLFYGLAPYSPPPSDEIAIVLGNTQNTPKPKISEDIANTIEETMLQHKGDDVDDLANSIKIISAAKVPEVINLDSSELKLQEIGKNSARAKQSAEFNRNAINQKIESLFPTDNGANYLEAILEAKNNVQEGSTIIVIGSGLSDEGDLNFSKTNILNNEQSRKNAIKKIEDKYGSDYLDGYTLEFHGLGDSVLPQEKLSSIQKDIVRDIYEDVTRSLGGISDIHTKTLVGDAVETTYIVGTTDTQCGDISLIFNDENLKFVSNQAQFIDVQAANESLMSIKALWDEYGDIIETIDVEGFIARYPGPDTLSQPRSDLVKAALVNLGIPIEKINAVGKGYGPNQEDSKNRIVKVTINRNSDKCEIKE